LWAFQRKRNLLDEVFLCSLHKRMFGKVWKWAGKYRETDRNIGVDVWNIAADLRSLLGDVQFWIENETYLPDEIAVRFHHRLVLIHPFPNGNGRWSRLVADLLIASLGGERFTWGKENLQEASAVRRGYIDALHAADAHDTAATVEKAFTQAMTATEDAIVGMVMSGEVSLSSLNDLAGSVIADITRMLVKQSITTPLFGMLTGGGGDDGAGFLGSIVSAIFHEGGIVGQPAPSRSVPAHVFAGAPRYHNGGIAGLRPNEVPAILKKGEEVIPQGKRRRSSPMTVVMNIQTPDANSFRASQGQITVEAAKGIQRARRNL